MGKSVFPRLPWCPFSPKSLTEHLEVQGAQPGPSKKVAKVCSCPTVAMTNDHKLVGVKQKLQLSQL